MTFYYTSVLGNAVMSVSGSSSGTLTISTSDSDGEKEETNIILYLKEARQLRDTIDGMIKLVEINERKS